MNTTFKIKNTSEAKHISSIYLNEGNLKNKYSFGLPEFDDRYKLWRVPILDCSSNYLGTIFLDAIQGNVEKNRSTNEEVMINRLNSHLNKIKPISKKRKKESYLTSDLMNTVIEGDSRNALRSLSEQSVDLVFTSPPYYNARPEYSEYPNYEDYLNLIRKVIQEAKRVLVDGRYFVINVSPVLIPRKSRSESSRRIAVPFDIHQLFIEEDFEFVDDIIWEKPEGAGWASGRGRRFSADRNALQYKPVPVTEYILVYRKKPLKLLDFFIRKHPDQNLVKDSKILGDYEKTNIWYISPARDKRHRAIFPKELAMKVIKYYSFKNDVILDPFGGIGTTAKAALDLDRRFVLIENKKEYVDATLEDLKQYYFDIYPTLNIFRN
ncbi:site-specific DNA-methyltransferase [Staphylococcus pseudintermedius]|uniref:DNA-methyltransferase n=1 Tax=Staphylococcus pseudintermedius TaxID=283734 RepID=UPI001A01727B|nr:site-specific DNA-methyltransferase [Staphylococcus pseudintermedius]MDK3999449.1 site-specific DNA-methyltransferase [Staphylococcus pseudintermedius]